MKYLGLSIGLTLAVIASARADEAERILKESGVTGGLVVHLGCADGRMTAELCQNDSFLVHGLEPSVAQVRSAREFLRSKDLYGKVSVEQETCSQTTPCIRARRRVTLTHRGRRLPSS